jgi:glycosyltransferase involved in cell wall biosynthesis
MRTDNYLVSVVIPAYNACSTIDETLRSVRSQSHSRLEIIVVDDGSSDSTVAIAQMHSDRDPRVKIIRQNNAGVAAARNAGWQSAQSDLIAFIDADDLWAPTKIERQLGAILSAGGKIGLVYSWYAMIDDRNRILVKAAPTFFAGDVLENIFEGNFIGNGSAVLVRREALVAANGFESRLRAKGAQGCEDLMFYGRVAENFHFAVVPDYLIGYRYLPENMSSDFPRMLRSWMLVVDEFAVRHPNRTAALNRGLRNYSSWLLRRALSLGRFSYFISSGSLLLQRDPLLAGKVFVYDLPRDALTAVWWKLLGFWYNGLRRPVSLFSIGDAS